MNEIDKNTLEQITTLAKKRILDKWQKMDYNDLVNDCVLIVLEDKQELSFENLHKAMNTVTLQWKNALTEYSEKQIKEMQTSFCRCCKEDKPIGAFGITTRKKTGKKIVQTYCSDCQRDKMRAYNRKKGMKESSVTYIEYPEHLKTKKERKAYYHKIWRERNKQKWNEYVKNRYHQNKKQKKIA